MTFQIRWGRYTEHQLTFNNIDAISNSKNLLSTTHFGALPPFQLFCCVLTIRERTHHLRKRASLTFLKVSKSNWSLVKLLLNFLPLHDVPFPSKRLRINHEKNEIIHHNPSKLVKNIALWMANHPAWSVRPYGGRRLTTAGRNPTGLWVARKIEFSSHRPRGTPNGNTKNWA